MTGNSVVPTGESPTPRARRLAGGGATLTVGPSVAPGHQSGGRLRRSLALLRSSSCPTETWRRRRGWRHVPPSRVGGLSWYTHSDDPYVTEGARVAARVLQPFGWPAERLQRCRDACEQHHAPRSRMAMGLEVELVRRSDLVDVTAGLVNFGLDRGWLRNLFHDVPRDGLWRLIGSAVLGELRHRPATLTHVFLSPRRTRP
jgi:hypothetical protein